MDTGLKCGEIETDSQRTPSFVRPRAPSSFCREDTLGEKQIVAYVVPTSEPSPSSQGNSSSVKSHLPDYMVPKCLRRLSALPLTPNGKVDRKALPAPETTHHSFAVPAVPPRTPVEELLVEISQDLLKVKDIGVHDNFFELGGHSLLATQVVARVRTLMQTDLSRSDALRQSDHRAVERPSTNNSVAPTRPRNSSAAPRARTVPVPFRLPSNGYGF